MGRLQEEKNETIEEFGGSLPSLLRNLSITKTEGPVHELRAPTSLWLHLNHLFTFTPLDDRHRKRQSHRDLTRNIFDNPNCTNRDHVFRSRRR